VRAGVAATDHDDMFTCRPEIRNAAVTGNAAVLQRQELHRKVNPAHVAAWDRQIARMLGAARYNNRIELGQQLLRGNRLRGQVVHAGREGIACPDTSASAKLDALLLHLLDAPVDQPLLHLEVGNAITQQPADAVVLLEQHDLVSRARELLRAGQPGRSGADYCNALAGLALRRLRYDVAE